MNAKVEILKDEAAKLTASERAALVEAILDSLDKTDPEIDRAWLEESERRLTEMVDGTTVGVSIDDVRAKLRARKLPK